MGCRDALAVTMATPVHSQENKAARRETGEGKRKEKKQERQMVMEQRLGQEGAVGREKPVGELGAACGLLPSG